MSDLVLKHAGGGELPYLGWTEVNLGLEESFAGTDKSFPTLALVTPDVSAMEPQVIIGTNTDLFQKCRQTCREVAGEKYMKKLSINARCSAVYKMMEKEQRLGPEGEIGVIRSRLPALIPAGTTMKIRGAFRNKLRRPVKVVVDALGKPPRPGLLPLPYVTSIEGTSYCTIQVELLNATDDDVRLPDDCPVARVLLPDAVSHIGDDEAYTNQVDVSCYATQALTRLDSKIEDLPFQWGPDTSPELKARVLRKLEERAEVFATHEWDLGMTSWAQHEINLTDETPFRERTRRVSPSDLRDLQAHIQELLDHNIIRASKSRFASPIVLVRKKNGTLRMCVDYRILNARSLPDQYTVPLIRDAVDCLNGSSWFSVIDLKSGFYQIPMREEDKEKTAFTCPLGFYEFQRMPQGIRGAPATFQRLMESCMSGINFLEALVYMDDIIVFAKSPEEMEVRLLKVLDRLHECGLKVSPEKCQFFCKSVKYLGHIVSESGVQTDPEKVSAVHNWIRPRNAKELRSFLGLTGYYRRFIEGYSKIAAPLHSLASLYGFAPKRGGRRSKRPKSSRPVKKATEPFESHWSDACEHAFQTLKEKMTTAPVLAYADISKPFVLHVDACRDGLGAVLCQDHQGSLRPVAYASKTLKQSEKNYPAHKLEFYALKWAITDQFKDYLYHATATKVLTDNNPLTYVLTSAKLDATGHRWLAALANFDFTIQYKPGRTNQDADALSRRPTNLDGSLMDVNDQMLIKDHLKARLPGTSVDDPVQIVNSNAISAIYTRYDVQRNKDCEGEYNRLSDETPLAYSLGITPACVPAEYSNADHEADNINWESEQMNDDVLKRVRQAVTSGNKTTVTEDDPSDLKLILREFPKLEIHQGVLYRRIHQTTGSARRQLVLPQKFRKQAITSLHNDLGHLGMERTIALARDRFYWPHMASDIDTWVRHCAPCLARKTIPKKSAYLQNITTSGPMELVCMDFLKVEPDTSNMKSILVVTDHFTRYAQAFPTKDQTAPTVAKVLWEKYFQHYGLPKRLHSDRGPEFESEVIKQLTNLLGVRKSHTSPYFPQGDPQPERFNRTLLNMLGTLNEEKKTTWSRHIGALVHAYNCTKNDSTGYSPYYLMFGREARLPIDVCFGLQPDGLTAKDHSSYVTNLRQNLHEAYEAARREAEKHAAANKKRYDLKVRVKNTDLQAGDRVLIRNLGLKGKNKLANRWNIHPYIVKKKLPDLPVYVLKPEKGDGPEKTLHRNHLLPVGYLIGGEPAPKQPKPSRPKTRSQSKAKQSVHCHNDDTSDEELDEFVMPVVHPSLPSQLHNMPPQPSNHVPEPDLPNPSHLQPEELPPSKPAVPPCNRPSSESDDDENNPPSSYNSLENSLRRRAVPNSSLQPRAKVFVPRNFTGQMFTNQPLPTPEVPVPDTPADNIPDAAPPPSQPSPVSVPPEDSHHEENPEAEILRGENIAPPTTIASEPPDQPLYPTSNNMDTKADEASSHVPDVVSGESTSTTRPRRKRHLPSRLVYDRLGEPSFSNCQVIYV